MGSHRRHGERTWDIVRGLTGGIHTACTSRAPCLLACSLEDTGQLVEGIRDDQWDRPTPCAAWSVRDLVNHLITGNQLFARALLADSPPTAPTSTELRPGQCATAYRESADALLVAFGSPG